MDDLPSLLPRNSTALVRAMEQAFAYDPRLIPSIDLIPDIKGRRLPSFLQFLLYEYGLIELTAYVSNPHTLLDAGRIWQIERDTFAAVARGLGWVNAPATIAEAAHQRAWWNSFQLYFDGLPPADAPDLERIEGVVRLSEPFRSDFRRGVFGYDVPPLEGDYSRLDYSFLDRESGVQLHAGGPLWSFGRAWEREHTLTEAEGTALGNWMEPNSDVEFLADLIALTISIDGDTDPLLDHATFARASGKWAQDVAGSWFHFDAGDIASTDRGAELEPAAERLSYFHLDENPLDADEPIEAADVSATGLADPLGGTDAIRVVFDGDTGRTFLVPAAGLLPDTTYGVSFFAKLVSRTGTVPTGSGDDSLAGFWSQLVVGEWQRVEGTFETGADVIGQWLDLTLDQAGAVVTLELFGFQVEEAIVTSPIDGDTINASRAADNLVLTLPGVGVFNLVYLFDDGSGQSLPGQETTATVDPTTLERPYVKEIATQKPGTWLSMAFPWTDADFSWVSTAAFDRASIMGNFFEEDGRTYYFALKDADGDVIGYRRARAARKVTAFLNGKYSFGGVDYATAPDVGQQVLFEAMTDAGNGLGQTVASVEIVVDGDLDEDVPPGRLWLAPDELSGGTLIAPVAIATTLRATVRERLKIMLRF